MVDELEEKLAASRFVVGRVKQCGRFWKIVGISLKS